MSSRGSAGRLCAVVLDCGLSWRGGGAGRGAQRTALSRAPFVPPQPQRRLIPGDTSPPAAGYWLAQLQLRPGKYFVFLAAQWLMNSTARELLLASAMPWHANALPALGLP